MVILFWKNKANDDFHSKMYTITFGIILIPLLEILLCTGPGGVRDVGYLRCLERQTKTSQALGL